MSVAETLYGHGWQLEGTAGGIRKGTQEVLFSLAKVVPVVRQGPGDENPASEPEPEQPGNGVKKGKGKKKHVDDEPPKARVHTVEGKDSKKQCCFCIFSASASS